MPMFCEMFVFTLLGLHLRVWISGSAAGVATFSYAKDGWPHFPCMHGSHHSDRSGGKVGGNGDDGSASSEFQANFEFQKGKFTVPHDSKIPENFIQQFFSRLQLFSALRGAYLVATS